jgi:hypothetical protein
VLLILQVKSAGSWVSSVEKGVDMFRREKGAAIDLHLAKAEFLSSLKFMEVNMSDGPSMMVSFATY